MASGYRTDPAPGPAYIRRGARVRLVDPMS